MAGVGGTRHLHVAAGGWEEVRAYSSGRWLGCLLAGTFPRGTRRRKGDGRSVFGNEISPTWLAAYFAGPEEGDVFECWWRS